MRKLLYVGDEPIDVDAEGAGVRDISWGLVLLMNPEQVVAVEHDRHGVVVWPR